MASRPTPTTTTANSSSEKPDTAVTLHPRQSPAATATSADGNRLPPLLQTPAGLALLELQGTINLPDDEEDGDGVPISIGRVDFPDWRPDSVAFDASSSAWMRRAYLYVGPHQRLTGEVKKLPRALGVVRRRRRPEKSAGWGEGGEGAGEELEVVDVVKYKIVFSSRPEPVGTE